MNIILTIIKKEFLETIRDKKTLVTMVIIPLVIMPVLMGFMINFQQKQHKKAEEKVIKLFVSVEADAAFINQLSQDEKIKLVKDVSADSLQAFIQYGKIDAAILFPPDFNNKISRNQPAFVQLLYKSSDDTEIIKARISQILESYKTALLGERLQKLNIETSTLEVFKIEETDIASAKEKFGKAIGGLLPYLLVIFGFIGCMYPGIDLGAGEKERGTIETLLTTPASRIEIITGKFIVVALIGIITAILSVTGIFIKLKTSDTIPSEDLSALMGIFDPSAILIILSLIVPLTVFFAGLILALSFYAKTFKEAQTYISPLMIIVMLPVAIGLLPGIELNAVTALIPVLNVSLAAKEILAGSITGFLLAEVYLSLFFLAGLSIYICNKFFQRESVIFRGM